MSIEVKTKEVPDCADDYFAIAKAGLLQVAARAARAGFQNCADVIKHMVDDFTIIADQRDEARKLAEELRDELHAHSVTEAAYDLDTAEPRKPTLPWEEK